MLYIKYVRSVVAPDMIGLSGSTGSDRRTFATSYEADDDGDHRQHQ